MANEIVLENQKQGNPESEWGLPNGASSSIEGFTTDTSVDQGGIVQFKIDTDSNNYRIDIYRLGYYDGDGARKVATFQHQNGSPHQPDPLFDSSRGFVDAGNWSVTDTWAVPADAVSGVYIAKLVRQDGIEGENLVPFVVRDDNGSSDIVFQTSDTTWQAYNTWGGSSLYSWARQEPTPAVGSTLPRAYAVSYNRPANVYDGVMYEEYAGIRWLEANGYDVSYISGVDTSRAGSELLEHNLFLSVGHDEYWSGEQRANVEAARDGGVNLAFWSGNEVYWKTRWEPSIDGSGTSRRTLVSYKDTWDQRELDPSSEWTGQWRDPNSPDGAYPENALTGSMFAVNGNIDTILIPYEYSQFRFWDNTSIAALQPGQTGSIAPGTLGYEWNIDADNGFRPAGLINLSTTTLMVNGLSNESGNSFLPGTATHNLTLYKASSGALVFGAGSVFWTWGLDSHNPENIQADPTVQQAMVNLFAEMGVQPESLKPGLVLGVQSTDHIAPQATISSVGAAAPIVGTKLGVAGTAHDLGGGVVAGVEVSGDGGLTWHKASGWDNWSYAWTPDRIGLNTIEARAVDDSLNLGAPGGHTEVFVGFQHPGFDPGYYRDTYLDVKQAGIDPYDHYANWGWNEGRNPSELFSTKDYLAAYADIAMSGINPLAHFGAFGWKEGRDPSADFDLGLYLAKYEDLQGGGNPLDHYLVYGKSEGRATFDAIGAPNTYGFDTAFYLLTNLDIDATKTDPFTHYLLYGAKEGRDPNPYFDGDAYLAKNPDVAAAGWNPLVHYDLVGWKEGRDPSPEFDTKAYLAAYSDVAAAGIDPLLHFLAAGIYEGRDPHSDGLMS